MPLSPHDLTARPTAVVALFAAAACAGGRPAASTPAPSTPPAAVVDSAPRPAMHARSELLDGQRRPVGIATLDETPHGIVVRVQLAGVSTGAHAIHFHAVGVCEPPFTTAGAHVNPDARQHGLQNPQGPHAGDLPNVSIAPAPPPPPPDTTARRRADRGQPATPPRPDSAPIVELLATGVTLSPGPASLFDADGSTLVLHAGPDDYVTDPSGNSGDRIACGVIARVVRR